MLTARFESVPESHDGSTAFTFELHFSEDIPALSYKTVTGGLFEVTGANVTGARRLTRGSNQGWLVTVAPNGSDDIAVSLPARACGETAAICAADGRALSESIAATVVGTPFVASFDTVPDEHDGSTRFTFHLLMSHEAHGLSYRTVRDALFDVSGGRVTGARRFTSGKNQNWAVTVEPSSTADVVVAVRGTESCDAANAVCTANRHKLPGGASITVPGPATLSVADAEVREGPDATLDFVVTLSRNRHEATTVNYGTSDGTATAGADYTAASGTLTFAAGETSKTVSVAVLDDALDEGSETLTLTLTNPEPSSVRLADAEATGTIRNTDKMPKAWIARFGREAANLVETEAETSRIRLLLEGSRAFQFGKDAVLTPSFQVGVRHDGGDAETGGGLEVGGSLRYAAKRLTIEISARGLLTHQESDYEEWGVSGSIRLGSAEQGRGLSMRLGSAWGAESGGAERLWAQRYGGFTPGRFDPDARREAEVAYGLDAYRGLLTPYTGVALTGNGETWRAGARWKLGPAFDVNLEASLREPTGDEKPESDLLLRGSKRW